MPRVPFNVHDGVDAIDREATGLPDRQVAWLGAVRRTGDILRADADRVARGEDWRIEVTDHVGLVLFHRSFPVIEAPILRPSLGRIG